MDVILAQSGNLSVQEAGDANLRRIFNLVRQRLRHSSIVENREDNEYLAVDPVARPQLVLSDRLS